MSEPENRINLRETAKRLGVHENTVRNWTNSGVIRCERLPHSGFRRFDPEEVERVRLLRAQVPTTAAELSRLLFDARELIDMFRDIVEGRAGKQDDWSRRTIAGLDAYRASKGWSPNGFGGEGSRPG